MPKQSRGFWVCSLCSQAFDRFEEASYHENEECPRRFSINPTRDQAPWQHQHFQPELYNMPPLSAMSSTIAVGYQRETSPTSFVHERPTRQQHASMLKPHDRSTLTESDAIACRNIEVFENNGPSQNVNALRKIGLRCSSCGNPSSFRFPLSKLHMGDCVRQIAEEHLVGCNSVPQSSRAILKQALKQRQQRSKERGSAWFIEEESRRNLIDFCSARCEQAGIVEAEPNNTGIFFGDQLFFTSELTTQNTKASAHRPLPLPSEAARRPLAPQDDVMRQANVFAERSPPVHYYGPPYDSAYDNRATYASGIDPSTVHPDSRAIQPSPYHPFIPSFVVPVDFPFVQERNGEWVCRYCSHLHPQLRDPRYYWMAPDGSPPPADFIDYHLSVCQIFQESRYQSMDYQGHPSDVATGIQHHGLDSSFSSATWVRQFDVEQQSETDRASPPYATMPLEHLSHGSSPYSRHPPIHDSQESQNIQRYGASRLPLSQPLQADAEYERAIEILMANDKDAADSSLLVMGEDKLLLTDYFYFVMRQLRQVRFSEADRRTRGGKRENIATGYGGLQCVHCADLPNARKFFWSNVDRLANSFAEIPSHVLKCRRCPQPTKDALVLLKQRHPDQMTHLPRGSQKVFFRRMWRRLHDEDPPANDEAQRQDSPNLSAAPQISSIAPSTSQANRLIPVNTEQPLLKNSPAGTTGSEESIILLQRSTEEAAKALAYSEMQPFPPSPSSRVLLAVPEDQKWLSDTDCFIRRQLEVFCSTSEDVENARSDRKYPVQEGQVGIRCIHCALSKNGARGQAVAYPFNISGIYEAAREFQRLHLESCENLPQAAKNKLMKLKGSSSLSSVLRKYYIIAANALGLIDTRDGIRSGGESIPIGSQAAFAFSDDSSPTNADDSKIMVKEDNIQQSNFFEESLEDDRKRASNEATGPAARKRPKRESHDNT